MKPKDNIIKYGLLAIVLIFASTLLIQKITSYDVWWHLKTGQYILEQKSVPKKDIFSYTMPDKTWIAHQWLGEVIMYTAYKLSGFKGLILFKTTVFLTTFFLLFILSYKKRYPFLSILVIALGILVASPRFFVRPFIFNALFLSTYLYLLMHYKYDNKRYIFFIPILHLFWANIHGGYLTGIILIALFLICEGITWKLKIPFLPEDPHCIKGEKYRLLFYIFLFTCSITLINPNGITGVLYPVTSVLGLNEMKWHELIMKHIGELQPTITRANILSFSFYSFYKWLLLIAWVSLILNFRRLQLTHVAIISVFSYFSIIAYRNILTFSVVAVPLAMYNLEDFLSQIKRPKVEKIIHSKLLNAVLFIPLGIFLFNISASQFSFRLLTDGKIVRSIGFGFNEWRYPFKAIDFIQKNNIPGNMFNSYESGGPLIWKVYPERKVFIDGRTDIYAPDLYLEYLRTGMEIPAVFDRIVKKYNINFVLFLHSPTYGVDRLIKYLFDSKEWRLIYFDYVACVFLKDTPQNANLLKKFEIKDNAFPDEKEISGPIPPGTIPFSPYRRAEFLRLIGLYDNAISEYEKTLKIDPELPIPRNSIGLCYYEKGDLEKAEQIFKETIEIAPKYPAAYNNLGSLYARRKLFDEAEKSFKKALELNPDYLLAHRNLANYYFDSDQKEKAVKEYRKVVSLYPLDTNSYERLGSLYYSLGKYKKAIKAFKEILEIEPDRATTLSNLGITYGIIEDYEKAVEYGEKAVNMDPEYADGHYNLGLIYSFMGDDKKAREYWLETLRINPHHKKARENLQELLAP